MKQVHRQELSRGERPFECGETPLVSQLTKLRKFTLVETGNCMNASKDTSMMIPKASLRKILRRSANRKVTIESESW